jgi:hypothetical protein
MERKGELSKITDPDYKMVIEDEKHVVKHIFLL